MDDVEPAGLLRGLSPQHIHDERAQPGRKVLSSDVPERACINVTHCDPGGKRDRRLHRAAGGSGEDLNLGAERGELPGQLDHVHIHPARVTGPRLFQR